MRTVLKKGRSFCFWRRWEINTERKTIDHRGGILEAFLSLEELEEIPAEERGGISLFLSPTASICSDGRAATARSFRDKYYYCLSPETRGKMIAYLMEEEQSDNHAWARAAYDARLILERAPGRRELVRLAFIRGSGSR